MYYIDISLYILNFSKNKTFQFKTIPLYFLETIEFSNLNPNSSLVITYINIIGVQIILNDLPV